MKWRTVNVAAYVVNTITDNFNIANTALEQSLSQPFLTVIQLRLYVVHCTYRMPVNSESCMCQP